MDEHTMQNYVWSYENVICEPYFISCFKRKYKNEIEFLREFYSAFFLKDDIVFKCLYSSFLLTDLKWALIKTSLTARTSIEFSSPF